MERNEFLNVIKSKSYAKAIILSAILMQIVLFVYYAVFGQMHIDEVMLMLNARSLADGGCDILGEHMPVYFDTWVYGGQSPLPTYLSAFMIKLFGYHLWLARLPMLIVSIAALIVFEKLSKAIFSNNAALANLTLTFFALQPARIYNSLWALDCAYFTPFFIIGIYFLNKAFSAEGKKYVYVTLAMAFFACACNSYITSVLILPVFLLVYYLVLIRAEKTDFSTALISALIFAFFMLPIILFGLVQFGVIGDFSLCGFSFSNMMGYEKQSSLIFSVEKSQIVPSVLNSIVGLFIIVLLPDFSLAFAFFNDAVYGSYGCFSYGHIISAVFILIFALFIIAAIMKKKKINLSPEQKAVVFSLGISYLLYGAVMYWDAFCLHRYTMFFVLFNIMSAAGAYIVIRNSKINVKTFKTVTVCLIVLSFALTSYCLNNFAYVTTASTTTRSFASAFDDAKEIDADDISIVSDDNDFKMRFSVYLRYRYYDNLSDFNSLESELKESIGHLGKTYNADIKKDGSIKYATIDAVDGGTVIFDKGYYSKNEEKIKSEFKILKDYGCLVLAEK